MKGLWALALGALVLGARGEAAAEAGQAPDDGPVVEEDVVGMQEEDPGLPVLRASELDGTVHRSRKAWAVLITASEGCGARCEGMEAMVESAARASKGLASFAKVDAANAEDAKALQTAQGVQVPQLRLYVRHGQPNAYRKGEFFREFEVFTGASARAINKKLADQLVAQELVVGLAADSWESELAETDVAQVVMLSSRGKPSPTTAGLALQLQGLARVAQWSDWKEDDAAAKALAEALGAPTAPALAVRAPGGGAWTVLEKSELSKLELEALVDKVAALAGIEEAATAPLGDAAAADGAGSAAQDKHRAARLGVLLELSAFKEGVEIGKMPVVLAVRLGGDAETPEGWDKLRQKSHGVSTFIVHCNAGEAEGPEEALRELVCDAHAGKSEGWALEVFEYNGSGEPRARGSAKAAESLSQARADALASVPELIMNVNDATSQGFVGMAVNSGQVPILLLGKGKDPPAMLISLAAAVQGLAMVGYRGGASPEELEAAYGIPKSMPVPQLVAMVVDTEGLGEGEQARMMLQLYDRARFGKFSFNSMLSFVLQVSSGTDEARTREWLVSNGAAIGLHIDEDAARRAADASSSSTAGGPAQSGAPMDDAATPLPQVESAERWAELCPAEEGQLLCVVALLDGDPLNEAQVTEQLAQLQAARETVLKQAASAGRARFMWLDATCQRALATALEVDLTGLPMLQVISPRKKMVFKMLAGFEQAKIEKFVSSVSNGFGKQPLKLSTWPEWPGVDCEALPERQAAGAEGDDADSVDDDWLREIREEEEREAKERKEQVKRELQELKEREAQKKADEAAAASKRRRRRRRRKRKAEKDEL